MSLPIPRSILCTPVFMASTLLNKVADYDGLLFDLEDSIPIGEKQKARSLLHKCIEIGRAISMNKNIYVRINSIKSKEGILDLTSIFSSEIAPDIIQLPKVETADEVIMAQQMLMHNFPDIKIQVIIETAQGLASIGSILEKTKCIHGLIFGAADFSLDIGTDLKWESLLLYRSELVKIARIHGVQVIDSPYFDYQDDKGLKEEVSFGYQLGFHGKMAIHPKQILAINHGYLPSQQKINLAFQIIEEAKKQKEQIFQLHGKMIGPPIVESAKKIVSAYQNYMTI